MHQRLPTRVRESVSPEGDDHGHRESSERKDASDEKASMHHLLSMVFLSTMLLCTILFLRYDNHQIGIAARAIGDMEKIIKDKDSKILTLQTSGPKCKQNDPQPTEGLHLQNMKLKDQVTDLERQLRQKTEELETAQKQKETIGQSELGCAEELGRAKAEIAELKRMAKRKWTLAIGG